MPTQPRLTALLRARYDHPANEAEGVMVGAEVPEEVPDR
jgi:hypothetical protein